MQNEHQRKKSSMNFPADYYIDENKKGSEISDLTIFSKRQNFQMQDLNQLETCSTATSSEV